MLKSVKIKKRSESSSGSGGGGFKHVKQVFSGIQPTSVPHLGNYFGAIRPWIDIQNRKIDTESQQSCPMSISIVDLHAITVPRDAKQLKYCLTNLVSLSIIFISSFFCVGSSEHVYQCTASLLACGLDPAKTIIYQQSQVLTILCTCLRYV